MSNEILEEFYVDMFKVHCTKYMYPSKREYLGSREKKFNTLLLGQSASQTHFLYLVTSVDVRGILGVA